MKTVDTFKANLDYLFTDIDDTLTDEGQLGPEAYEALWNLHQSGIKVIPVTGRPAGWCEMIARMWPVAGVVGENGGFYFRYHNKKMIRNFYFDFETQAANREKLDRIQEQVLREVPGCAIASDQFCRLMDLAVDFCEDVRPLPADKVQKIVDIFKSHGAQAKVSSIHVNGWFGTYDKVTKSLQILDREFGVSATQAKQICGFVGDSPNDEPMFEYFPHSFAVANLSNFVSQLKSKPSYLASKKGGLGFVQIAEQILQFKSPTSY
ncbi:MAG: HAD-IIB family hydrolase [Pseudobdellovibrionaceae bacterium]